MTTTPISTLDAPPAGLDAPYVGVRPYKEEQRALFRGRENESTVLINKILANPVTVLFAPSGAGKSSLLNVLVIPGLRALEAQVVTVDQWTCDPVHAIRGAVAATLDPAFAGNGDKTLLDLARTVNKATDCSLVVILDQFEQFFLLQSNHIEALGREIGSLARSGVDGHIVIALREEYLGRLEAFREHLLTVAQATYRLGPLSDDDARRAIAEPLALFQGSIDKDLLDVLVRELRTKGEATGLVEGAAGGEGISLPFLQIVCSHLWDASAGQPERRLTMNMYEGLGRRRGIVDGYVREVMRDLVGAERLDMARMLDLLAPKEGVKMAYPVDVLADQVGLDRARLDELLNYLDRKAIVRRRDGGRVVELYHDAFTEVLRRFIEEELSAETVAKQTAERARELNRQLELEHAEAEARDQAWRAESKAKAARTRGIVIAVLSAALVITLGSTWRAVQKGKEAERERETAVQKGTEALQERERAEVEAELARTERKRAEEEKKTAEERLERIEAMLKRSSARGGAPVSEEKALLQDPVASLPSPAPTSMLLSTPPKVTSKAVPTVAPSVPRKVASRIFGEVELPSTKEVKPDVDQDGQEREGVERPRELEFRATFTHQGSETYLFKIFPDLTSLAKSREKPEMITYRMDHPSFRNPLIVAYPKDGFVGSYEGRGCLNKVTAIIEYDNPQIQPELTVFDMCAMLTCGLPAWDGRERLMFDSGDPAKPSKAGYFIQLASYNVVENADWRESVRGYADRIWGCYTHVANACINAEIIVFIDKNDNRLRGMGLLFPCDETCLNSRQWAPLKWDEYVEQSRADRGDGGCKPIVTPLAKGFRQFK